MRSRRNQSPQATLQQDKVVARRDTRLAVRLLGLPPPSTDIGDFEYVMLLEADLVCVVGVRFVAVNRLGAVGVLDTLLCGLVLCWCLCAHAAELRGG